MTEPTTTTGAGVAAGLQHMAAPAAASAFAGALTGFDYWTLLAGFAGALLAMTKQEPAGALKSLVNLFSVVLFALFVTWGIVELLPFVFPSGPGLIGKARTVPAWLVGYFAQSAILPAGAKLISSLAERLGGEK